MSEPLKEERMAYVLGLVDQIVPKEPCIWVDGRCREHPQTERGHCPYGDLMKVLRHHGLRKKPVELELDPDDITYIINRLRGLSSLPSPGTPEAGRAHRVAAALWKAVS